MRLFEPTLSGTIFRRGCCRKTQLCEQDDTECRLPIPKAFVSSAGILNLPITSIPVDNFSDRALWCKPTGINYNMHGWIMCRYCATGWFWWIRGFRAVTIWSSSSFTITTTKTRMVHNRQTDTLSIRINLHWITHILRNGYSDISLFWNNH